MIKKKILLALISFLLLLVGLLLYMVFNRDTYVSSFIVMRIPFSINYHPTGVISDILRGYGADFLWTSALTIAVQAILYLKKSTIWLLLFCSSLGVLFELLQFLKVTNGTADVIDVIIYVMGSAFGIIMILGGKFYEER